MALSELLSYQGNAGLAGGQGAGANLGQPTFNRLFDAVDRFTAFTMQVNRDLWVQSNLEMQKVANEASRQLEVQYGDLIPEDREVVDGLVKEMYEYYDKNPNAVKYIVDPRDPTKNNAKEYGEFLSLRKKLDHVIVRGNIRAQQLGHIDQVRSTVTDPQKLQQFDAMVGTERKKPIGENLLIPPDIAPFNWSSYLEKKTAEGQRSYEYLQRFPNDILQVTKDLFDPFAASAFVANDLNSNTPVGEELKKTLALQFVAINEVMNRHRIPDGNGGTRLDMAGLEADNDARPFMEQIRLFNNHVRTMNNTDVVEGGTNTKMKVRELMGYHAALPEIDVNNLSEMDLVRMGMTYKIGVNTKLKPMQTDNQIQRRGQDLAYAAQQNRLAWDKESFWYTAKQGEKAEKGLADEKILSYYNLMTSPLNGTVQMETTRDKSGKIIKQVPIGTEVGVTPQLSEIFAIPIEKKKTTVKETGGAGAYTNQGFTSTVDETAFARPTRIFVTSNEGNKNPNQNRIKITYDDGSRKEFTAAQAFTAFNKLYGKDEKVQSKLSEISIRRLAEWGLTQPDLVAIGKQLGNINAPAAQQPGAPPAQQQTRKKKPKPY